MMKKVIALALSASMLSINTMPLACSAKEIKAPKMFVKKNKVIKSQVTQYDYVNIPFWEAFNDPYLTDYINRAIKNNYDLKIATLTVEQYKQMTKIQLANELPSAGIGAAPNLMKMPETTSTEGVFAMPMYVSYEADIFLKNHDKTKSAKKEWEASKYSERAAYISIASAVGTTYFNIIKLDKIISIEQELISSRNTIYNLMKQRNQIGITSTADMVRANKALIAAQSDLLDLEKQRTQLLNMLAVLIGDSPENISEIKRAQYSAKYDIKIPEAVSTEVIVSRPDYMKAEKMIEKAGIDVRVAKKEFLPSINIIGLLSFMSSSAGGSFSWANALGMLGASAMLPVLTGGKRIANLRLQKNIYEQVLQNYYKTNLTAIQEVNDALVILKKDDEKYKTNLEVENMEKQDFVYNERRYKEGIISNLDLLQRKENLLSVNKLVAQNKMDCNINYIGLYKAVGSKL